MQTFWLIRHAQRLDFIEPAWFETAIYPYDPPLSSQGLDWAMQLAQKFADIPIDRVITSPFLRTIQTGSPLATLLQLPLQLEWGLCEWLCSDWTPALPKTTPIDELIRCYPNIDVNYQSLVMPCYPETLKELDERLTIIAQKLTRHHCDNLLTIAHKGSVLGIVAALTGEDEWRNYDLPCGGIIKLTHAGVGAASQNEHRWQSQIWPG
ncbi:histidine phosphatase family protein [Chamaesiphon sp. VAR_69_metabat_338]|uniref:histidine phosphatase family protein n=1 Tax=Chamaesiphon sp. VAR_69_metabat_338 TaxID=2964704 RepID=UPI00286E9848|nr:histidine phosphatase family protein [Chamaesiphon sp. VAR_69_metabat_338]